MDESCDMRELTVVLESLADVYGEYPTLQAWKKIKIDRERFEKEAYYTRILEFREQVNRKFLDKAVEEIRQKTAVDKDLAFELWFEVYTQALEAWEGEVFGNLCEYTFDFKGIDLEKVIQCKSLNLLVLDEKWPEAYQWLLAFAENSNLPDSRRSTFYLYCAQIVLYYFGYPDKTKELIEQAEQVFSGNPLTNRVRAESLIVSRDFDKARSLLLNAMNADPHHVENYNYLGDSYLNEQKFEAAEQWYNDALHINFLNPLPYTKLINLFGDPSNPERDSSAILPLFEKAIRFVEKGKFNNYPYILHRETGNAFHKVGHQEKAVQYYLKAVDLHPDYTSAKVELAYVFINQSKFEEGEKWLKAAIDEKWPQINFAAYWGLGWLYEPERLNKLPKAIAYYRKCLGLRIIGDDRVYNVIGNLYFSLNEFENSSEFYRRAIEEYPLEIVYHDNLKGSLEKIGDSRSLVDYYDRLIKYFPGEAIYHNDAGVVHFGQGNVQKAITFYNRAIELNPNIPVFWENRGIAREKLKEFDLAISDYLQFLEIKQDASVYNAVGKLKYWQGKSAEALEFYNKAIDMEGAIAVYFENRALAYESLNRVDEALSDYLKAGELKEGALVFNNIGRMYYWKKEYEPAIENYTKAIALDSSMAVFFENRALVYRDMNNFDLAEKDFLEALAIDGNKNTYNHLGIIKLNKMEYEEAVDYFSEAINLSPAECVLWENRALAYEYLGRNDEANADYRKALTINESPVSYNGIGKIKYWSSDFDAAYDYFLKATELDPENEIYRDNLEKVSNNRGLRPIS